MRGVSGIGISSSSISSSRRLVVENLSGLAGGLRSPKPGAGPAFRLLLCPGTRLIGLSSSANLSLAAAVATHGVGLSSGGEEDDDESSRAMAIERCGWVEKKLEEVGVPTWDSDS